MKGRLFNIKEHFYAWHLILDSRIDSLPIGSRPWEKQVFFKYFLGDAYLVTQRKLIPSDLIF